MSHVTTAKTTVQFKDKGLLLQALDSVGTTGTAYMDYYGKEFTADIAVTTPNFQRGIGFVLENGQYVPKLDNYGHQKTCNEIISKIQMKYQEGAVMRFLHKKRYSATSQEQTEKGQIRIHARRY